MGSTSRRRRVVAKKAHKGGRPLRRHSASEEKLSVRLTTEEMTILRDYCWRFDQSASEVVRTALAITGAIPDWIIKDSSGD